MTARVEAEYVVVVGLLTGCGSVAPLTLVLGPPLVAVLVLTFVSRRQPGGSYVAVIIVIIIMVIIPSTAARLVGPHRRLVSPLGQKPPRR